VAAAPKSQSIITGMSQLKELLLSQIAYSAWATGQLLSACSGLTADQLDRGLGASHSSIIQTFCHVYDCERVWMRRLIGSRDEQLLPAGPAPELTFGFLVQSRPALWQTYFDWIQSAKEAELIEVLATVLPDGKLVSVPRWQILLHTVNHSTLHRGQVVTMLRTLGIKPPNTDLTAYWLTV
jgi:uncharacterized damage-inducible protein DinB